MNKIFSSLFLTFLFCTAVQAQSIVNSDHWAATDALGRKVGRYDGEKNDKQVIMFYWTWNIQTDAPGSRIRNISEIVRKYPEAMLEADHHAWQNAPGHFWWEEPLFGYFYTAVILGAPEKAAMKLAQFNAITTAVNAVLAVIISTILYLAIRPRLENNGVLKKVAPKY